MIKSYVQDGFTLIELMIVVSIIGILMVFAIPTYQNYMSKTQVTRVMYESSQVRVIIEDCLQNGRVVLGSGAKDCDPNITGSTLIQGNSQVGIELSNQLGFIQITNPMTATTNITAVLSDGTSNHLVGKKVVWRRGNDGNWYCESSIPVELLPKNCKYEVSL